MRQICLLAVALCAVLVVSGCKEEVTAERSAEEAALLDLIPSDLRFSPAAKDSAAQARYIEIKRQVNADPLAGHGDYRQDRLPCRPETIAFIRKVMKSGPLQAGYAKDIDDAQSGVRMSMNPGLLLGISGLIEINAGRKSQGIEDLILLVKWHRQTRDPYKGETSMSLDQRGLLSAAMTMKELSRAEKLQIIDAFWSDAEIAEIQKNFLRLSLERSVRTVAALESPRKDMVVSRLGFHRPGESGLDSDLQTPHIVVPPHGTLDRKETVKALLELARSAMAHMDPSKMTTLPAPRYSKARFIKWLPPKPGRLASASEADLQRKREEVRAYVDEMNNGSNTLGREFIAGTSFISSGGRSVQEEIKSSLRQMVEGVRS